MSLVASLNELLAALYLPFVLDTPLDLTPSLLIAILECILELRLAIPDAIRSSRNMPDRVQAMKIFLGVLENDVIHMDVGLSDVDPRKLAAGEREEVVFIGDLLCWLGRKMGLLDGSSATRPPQRRTQPPSNISDTITNTMDTDLSMHSANSDSETSIMSNSHSSIYDVTPPSRPRCIHEIEEVSVILPNESVDSFSSVCDCSANIPSHPAVRPAGWINHADEDSEIASFEAGRSRKHLQTPQLPSSKQNFILTRHTSPTQHNLALLNERANLLAELAKLKRVK